MSTYFYIHSFQPNIRVTISPNSDGLNLFFFIFFQFYIFIKENIPTEKYIISINDYYPGLKVQTLIKKGDNEPQIHWKYRLRRIFSITSKILQNRKEKILILIISLAFIKVTCREIYKMYIQLFVHAF